MAFEYRLLSSAKIDQYIPDLFKYLKFHSNYKELSISGETIFIDNSTNSNWKTLFEMYPVEGGYFVSSIMNRKEVEHFLQKVCDYFKEKGIDVDIEED